MGFREKRKGFSPCVRHTMPMIKTKTTFLILILLQGLHSIEEYMGKLWDVFPPAKYLTSLFSKSQRTGFLIANIGIFIIGLIC